jgi:TIR domain
MSVDYDVFLSHSREDAEWVGRLAARLEDEHGFRAWLDRWRLVPGLRWQPEVERGLRSARTCAVCLGGSTPERWFQQEIEVALSISAQKPSFRVIPLLLPRVSQDYQIPPFLDIRMWADFREDQDSDYALHVLCQGIKGDPIGRWPPRSSEAAAVAPAEEIIDKLRLIHRLRNEVGLHETVMIEKQRELVSVLLNRSVGS